MVASAWGPQVKCDVDTSTDERDDACLLAGDEAVNAGITDQHRVALGKWDVHYQDSLVGALSMALSLQ